MRETIMATALAAMVLSASPAGASSICGDVNDNQPITTFLARKNMFG
ncbi:MAG: hypothetical protein HY899_13175 [Deltaproteobacteria bacterium]|nr:hypothetical protein [Deltaproteobacteria bacterium]